MNEARVLRRLHDRGSAVAFHETVTERVEFGYTHMKQTGQYARVIGRIEPLERDGRIWNGRGVRERRNGRERTEKLHTRG